MEHDTKVPDSPAVAGLVERTVSRQHPERENSAEWFAARAEEVRLEIEAWPRWMRNGLDVAAARWPT